MNETILAALNEVFAGRDVPVKTMQGAIGAIMDGETEEIDIVTLLTALKAKGEAVSEIVGAAQAMHERALKIPTTKNGLLDTCGTGGDSLHTFNISTATAFVVAACGVPVAKHGNRSVSSSSGSADVLEALGVNINLTPDQVGECLDQVGIAFCFAPLIHGAMKHAAPVRRKLKFRTIFNLLGPLTNPASAEFQLLGVNEPASAEKIAHALAELGRSKAIVVCGNRELDEVSLWGPTVAHTVTGHTVSTSEWTAADFGLNECSVDELVVESPQESAKVIQTVFNGEAGAAHRIVVANAAAALIVAGKAGSPNEGAIVANEAIASGGVAAICQKLAECSNSLAAS